MRYISHKISKGNYFCLFGGGGFYIKKSLKNNDWYIVKRFETKRDCLDYLTYIGEKGEADLEF